MMYEQATAPLVGGEDRCRRIACLSRRGCDSDRFGARVSDDSASVLHPVDTGRIDCLWTVALDTGQRCPRGVVPHLWIVRERRVCPPVRSEPGWTTWRICRVMGPDAGG